MYAFRKDHVRRIDREYDKIFVSTSGGKDSIACLIYARQHYPKDKVEAVWVNVGWDFPSLYPYMIWIADKLDIKLNMVNVPTPFPIIAAALGFLAYKNTWCGPEAKFISIESFFDQLPKGDYISFEGSRRAESNRRSGRPWFSSASESFVKYPTYRPVLEMSDREVCNYCVGNTCPLLPGYRVNDRSGCYLCPNQTLQGWAVLRMQHPNLFAKTVKLVKIGMYNQNYKENYAKDFLIRITKHKFSRETFTPPYTAGYTNDHVIEQATGIKFSNIADDPNYTFTQAIEECNLSIDLNVYIPPIPDRHKEWIEYYNKNVSESDKIPA